MSDHADKAEHYGGLMLTYYDLAKQAKSPFQGNSYRKVATQCRSMAKEAFALADADARQAKDEARRIAINIARLPELLGKADRD